MKANSGLEALVGLQTLCLVLFLNGLQAQEVRVENNSTIRIGVMLEDSLSVEARHGAEKAAKEINDKGGLQGREIELLFRSMEGPWGQGSKQAVDLIFDQEVWALVGSNQGRNAHLVEQVIAKTSVVFISAWTADPTLAKAYVPHFFNCVSNSEQQAEAILADLLGNKGITEWVLVSSPGYDSQKAVEGITSRSSFRQNPPLDHFVCRSEADLERIAKGIDQLQARAAVIFCEPGLAWQLIRRIRSTSNEMPLYGRLALLDENVSGPSSDEQLKRVYVPINGRRGNPGARAAYAYDAVRLLADAIVRSGFDRGKLMAAVSETVHEGKTGRIEFDALGNRKGLPELIEPDSENFFMRKP
jgi:hypothetical protein